MIFGITLTAVMGVASIAPALPRMARVLDVSNERIGLLITVFTLPGMFLTPVLGIFADRIGRKAILVPSLFLFGIAGTACAFATDFTWLLILRFIQGIGGASLGALNVTLIGDLYEADQRATAMGYNSSILSVVPHLIQLLEADLPSSAGTILFICHCLPFRQVFSSSKV